MKKPIIFATIAGIIITGLLVAIFCLVRTVVRDNTQINNMRKTIADDSVRLNNVILFLNAMIEQQQKATQQ